MKIALGARLAGAALLLASLACHAGACGPNLQIEGGRGDDVDVAGVAIDHALGDACDDDEMQVHLLARLDHWRARAPEPAVKHVLDASVTPFLRWPVGRLGESPLFADLGIGFHAISHTRINAEREMSTGFQFGEFAGISTHVNGEAGEDGFELGLRLQHVSNGGIKHPNDGITYPLITLSRPF